MSSSVTAAALIALVMVNLITYYLLHRSNELLRARQPQPSPTPAVALSVIGGAPAVLLSKGRHRMLPDFPVPRPLLVLLSLVYPALLAPALFLHLHMA